MSESMKTVRVLQGHSICFRGEWFNQGAVLEVPASMEPLTNRAKYDTAGKYLGDEIVSQVETIQPEAAASQEA